MKIKKLNVLMALRGFGFVLLLFACSALQAQYTTTLEVTDTRSATLKEAMEKNGTLLLTELNNAQAENRSLSFKGIDIDPDAASLLHALWEVCPFRCDELDMVSRCLKTANGFQVRDIPVIMEPVEGERYDDDKYQEIVLNYNAVGKITNLCFAVKSVIYRGIMRSELEVADLERRSMVLDFVEQFRTAYNRKDLNFLKDVFSDDALIITGKVIQRVKKGDRVQLDSDVEYTALPKSEYLARLSNVFRNNARINVVFEDIKVKQHAKKDSIYGVKLVQHWNSGAYSDTGYLFLLWDFSGESPQIHVRTWQPYENTPKEKVFGLNNFQIKD